MASLEQAPGDVERQGNLLCCCPWGHKESDMMEQLNNKCIYFAVSGLSCGPQLSSGGARASLLCGICDLSLPTGNQTCVPCFTRQILSHWTIREVPQFIFQLIHHLFFYVFVFSVV